VAGLVYSICMNYHKRVKGNRSVGKKVFLQGGVCYNRAVPLAMAAVTGKTHHRSARPGTDGRLWRCPGDQPASRSRPDGQAVLLSRVVAGPGAGVRKPVYMQRRPRPVRPEVRDRPHPHRRKDPSFGGACNRWYNLRLSEARTPGSRPRPPVGAPRLRQGGRGDGLARRRHRPEQVLLHRHVLPALPAFLRGDGLCVVLPESVRQEAWTAGARPSAGRGDLPRLPSGSFGAENRLALPAALQRGAARSGNGSGRALPRVSPARSRRASPTTWARLQGPPGLSRFEDRRARPVPRHRSLEGLRGRRGRLSRDGSHPWKDDPGGQAGYAAAVQTQKAVETAMREAGRRALEELQADPAALAVVIFGRSYNAFVSEAHMGIPESLPRAASASSHRQCSQRRRAGQRSDVLDGGQAVLKAARFVERHPQLFGCYITNFSCGPDSFLIGYFRESWRQALSHPGAGQPRGRRGPGDADRGLPRHREGLAGAEKGKARRRDGRLRSFAPSRFDTAIRSSSTRRATNTPFSTRACTCSSRPWAGSTRRP